MTWRRVFAMRLATLRRRRLLVLGLCRGFLKRCVDAGEGALHLLQMLIGNGVGIRLPKSGEIRADGVRAICGFVRERIQSILSSFLLESPIFQAELPHLPPPKYERGNRY